MSEKQTCDLERSFVAPSISKRYAPKLSNSKSTMINNSVNFLRPGDLEKNALENNKSYDSKGHNSISQRYNTLRTNNKLKENTDRPSLLTRLKSQYYDEFKYRIKAPSLIKCFSANVPEHENQSKFQENPMLSSYMKIKADN